MRKRTAKGMEERRWDGLKRAEVQKEEKKEKM